MDEFAVSHTKDDILWLGSEEEDVQERLRDVSADYVAVARDARKGSRDDRGPTDLELRTAVAELQEELSSSEMLDLINIEVVPPPEVLRSGVRPLLEATVPRRPDFQANLNTTSVYGYLSTDMSPFEPYVVLDSTADERITVLVNTRHPHFEQLEGNVGVLNYLRHCTYDAIAEWQARHKAATIDPMTIKMFKDRLLRIPLQIEMDASST